MVHENLWKKSSKNRNIKYDVKWKKVPKDQSQLNTLVQCLSTEQSLYVDVQHFKRNNYTWGFVSWNNSCALSKVFLYIPPSRRTEKAGNMEGRRFLGASIFIYENFFNWRKCFKVFAFNLKNIFENSFL